MGVPTQVMSGKYCDFELDIIIVTLWDNWGISDTTHTSQFALHGHTFPWTQNLNLADAHFVDHLLITS